MLQRMSGEADPKYLAVLASVVQPPVGYQREELKEYDWHSPLNHLVDAVPPESETARKFKDLVNAIVAGNASPEEFEKAKEWLTLWRDNDAKLEPSLKKSDITAELAPLSQSLSQVSAIGLRALDDLQNHRAADAATTQNDTQTLKAAEKPQAVLRDMVVAPVEMLVQAAGSAETIDRHLQRNRSYARHKLRTIKRFRSQSCQELAHRHNLNLAAAAHDIDAHRVCITFARDIDAAVSDLEVANANMLQFLRQCGVMQINPRLTRTNFQPEASLQHHEDRSCGPGLRRTGDRVKRRPFARTAAESAYQFGKSMEHHLRCEIEQTRCNPQAQALCRFFAVRRER